MNQPKKNILAIVSYPFLPATTGGEISTLNILNYMAIPHNVTVFTVEPYNQNFKSESLNFKLIAGMKFSFWRYLNVFIVFKLLRLIKSKNIDLIFFDQPFMGWMMPFLKVFSNKKIFLRSNNIEYLRFKSMGKIWWKLMYCYEKFTYRSADLVIFVSDVDRQKAILEFGLNEQKTFLTPYGIELTEIPIKIEESRKNIEEKYSIKSDEMILLFFATMSYQPNYEAVEFIAEKIYPILKTQSAFDFKILICGKNLPEFVKQKISNKSEIVYCGFVDDINTYIDACDVMINPILSGGGVKTKAIDTLARNKIVISTTTGAEGIDPTICGSKLVVMPDLDWQAFVESIIENRNKNEKIPESFYETYSWTNIIKKLTIQLQKL